jgi:hypothetical protein
VRIARDLGTVSHLLPEGVASLRDAPYPLFHAIKRALMFLNFDEMREEDIPPRKIWLDNEELSRWFADLKREHRQDRGGGIEDPQRNSVIDLMVK